MTRHDVLPHAMIACMDGKTIREARLALGKTQQQMASGLGVSVRQWSRWESGATVPPADLRERLESLGGDLEINLAEVSSTRLVKELMSRARQWDNARIGRDGINRRRGTLQAVASTLEDLPEEDDDDEKG